MDVSNELIRPLDIGPPPLNSGDGGQRLSGREVIDTLFRQKWRILLLWSLVAIATVAYVAITPAMYQSEMTILVKDKRADTGITAEGAERGDASASDTQLATEMQLLSSRELFRMVAVKTGIAKQNDAAELDRQVERLHTQVRVAPVLKSSLIEVKYSDPNPKLAAAVLQTMADLYMDMHLQLHSSPQSFEFFNRQAMEYEKKLREAQERLLEFQGKHRIVMLAEQKDLTLRKLLEVEAALRDAQAQRAETALRATKLREQMAGMGRRITTQTRKLPNQYMVERLNTMLAELQNKRTEMLSKFRPDDRMVKQVDQQIADTRKALENAGSTSSTDETTDVNPVRQAVEGELARADVATTGLNARIASLGNQIRELRAQLGAFETASPDDQVLLHEVAVAEQNFALYSKKREEARIAQEMDKQKIANVAIVDPPRVAAFAKSKLGSGVPAAFLLGTLLVVAFCFAMGHRRNVVHTPWELEASMGLPVLATVPLHGKPMMAERVRKAPVLIEGRVSD